MDKMLSIKVPERVFQKLQSAAQLTQQTIDDVIVNAVNATLVEPSGVPAPLAYELALMSQLKDEALWHALRPAVTPEQQQRLQMLSEVAEIRPLSALELEEQGQLLLAHHRSVLRRAQAIAILTLRGHTISDPLLTAMVA